MTLASPFILPCGARLPNRLAKAAMSEDLGDRDHGASDALLALYTRWSASGAGLLLTGNLMVDSRHLGEPGNVVSDTEAHLERLQGWAAASKRGGGAVWAQLNHPGRQAPRTLTPRPVAPSSVGLSMLGLFARPEALTEAGIHEVIERFADGADRVRRAGFDGVQIHAAHGYLLSQFLSPRTNQRTDAWGGSLEARARLLLDVVRAVRARVGPAWPVSVKLNSADFQRGGFTADEAVRVATWLGELGVDLLELSGGNYEQPAMMGDRETTRQRTAYFMQYAEQVRAATAVPLMVTGGFRTRSGMDAALASGALDIVGLARPFAVDPSFGRHLLDGAIAEIDASNPSSGFRKGDDLLAVAWYQAQFIRMAAGADPDVGLGAWRTLFGKAIGTFWR
ncbi:MAG: NADH:flavin oxidoreductase/NADH oxidase family protein [Pseudomonadota bacterium]|nr:NADH:flavin oxidoreductase/NADH oxidase family protein [Pseudomonadota bacterium]